MAEQRKRQYSIRARKTVIVNVYVEAVSPDEALRKFADGDWIDEMESDTEGIERLGSPKECK